ncbi:hypothetical protein DUNSADRAFT_12155 [Dunaliella salina]|uniref:Encoded protein n=1 Tax=Dunaliella salina TaxID=3046 RepID=A0ABQ7GBW9_DUNSA|nr:hypothetical protein DUNSADRAFT_12155 [Dunaliella salina]|eukprot:KAF5832106.1 hypothetical protein DUNSADRAFT_12155 [Dunaliella salina]
MSNSPHSGARMHSAPSPPPARPPQSVALSAAALPALAHLPQRKGALVAAQAGVGNCWQHPAAWMARPSETAESVCLHRFLPQLSSIRWERISVGTFFLDAEIRRGSV